jgi:hypothetical protein
VVDAGVTRQTLIQAACAVQRGTWHPSFAEQRGQLRLAAHHENAIRRAGAAGPVQPLRDAAAPAAATRRPRRPRPRSCVQFLVV